MVHTTYISVPGTVEVGDVIHARIKPVCIDATTASISYGFGAKGVDASDHEITKVTSYSKTAICGQEFTFDLTITEDMKNRQRNGQLCGVWATQTTGKGIAVGYFKISAPEAIMGSVRVFRSYSCRSGRSGPIATWYFDIYYNGIAEAIGSCFGDGYACPSCRIMDEYTGEYARKFKYIRQVLYDKRATDPEEKAWMDTNLIVVPNDWTPMDGPPDPKFISVGGSAPPTATHGDRVCVKGTFRAVNDIAIWENAARKEPLVMAAGCHGPLSAHVNLLFNVDGVKKCHTTSFCLYPSYDGETSYNCCFDMPSTDVQIEIIGNALIGTAVVDPYDLKYNMAIDRKTFHIKSLAKICTEGEKRNPTTCRDGKTIIHEQVCKNNTWVSSGEKCSCIDEFGKEIEVGARIYAKYMRQYGTVYRIFLDEGGSDSLMYTPDGGGTVERTVCRNVKLIVCTEGEKRNPKTCWDGSKIHEQLCMGNKWVPSGETCPPEPATGEKRGPKTCWDGSVIHAEKFDATLKQWVPSGETCPPKPECTEGDKKAGYVCVAGKWQTAPAVPEPVVEPTVPEPEVEEPCYIKLDIPLLDMLPGIPCRWWVLPIFPGFKRVKKP